VEELREVVRVEELGELEREDVLELAREVELREGDLEDELREGDREGVIGSVLFRRRAVVRDSSVSEGCLPKKPYLIIK
jgi:hypothetical protein